MAELDELFPPLTQDEKSLLRGACEPFRLAGRLPKVEWPVWDFVARTFARESASVQPPEEVLSGLPVGVSMRDDGRPYRLYWLEPRLDGVPGDATTFGLTIAGMHALRSTEPLLGALADEIASYIGGLARAAEELPPMPYEVAHWDASLPDYSKRGDLFPYTFPASAVAALLQHESAVITVSTIVGNETCRVSGRTMRPFLRVTSAEEYLSIAWGHERPTSRDTWVSPMTLIQTIDYFGYVLEATSGWPKDDISHVVRPRSLSAAASLGLPAVTREDFESRVSGTCTVIDQLALPKMPDEVRDKAFNGYDGSVNRLSYFLSQRVRDEPYASDAARALKVLRDVRDLRLVAQHDSRENRARAARARSRFGLSAISESWESDWNLVRVRLASALSRIIDALQATESS